MHSATYKISKKKLKKIVNNFVSLFFQIRVRQRAALLAAAHHPRQLAVRHQVPAEAVRGVAVGDAVPARLKLREEEEMTRF